MTNKKSFYKVRNGVICNEAAMNPEDNYPWDLGMVPTGTKCGDNMVSEMLFYAEHKSSCRALWSFMVFALPPSVRCATIKNVRTSKT